MTIDFHEFIFGSRRKEKPREGTEIGFLVKERTMCWSCYGEGVDFGEESQKCVSCGGAGFHIVEHSLPQALAALNIVSDENSESIWVSKNIDSANRVLSKYFGVKIYAYCPIEIKPDKTPYAFIVKTSDRVSLANGFNYLQAIVDGVMEDFFSRYATEANEVSWFFRELNGDFYRLELSNQETNVVGKLLAKNWDGSSYDDIKTIRYFDNRIKLMIKAAIASTLNGQV